MPTAYLTAPADGAAELARTLVEERLAACVNRVPCRSTYRWEGEIHADDEVILLAKTTAAGYDDLVERVVELHPYEAPCIERFDEDDVFEPFEAWIADAVESR
ncbi:divalent-cation tolerance protein CutA [Haloferacaceae archaeon DSL9]